MPRLIPALGSRLRWWRSGAGSAEKSRIILREMGARRGTAGGDLCAHRRERRFSGARRAGSAWRREYPALTVTPAVADISEELEPASGAWAAPALFAFLGSTIGNFYPPAAIRLLTRLARGHAGRRTGSSWAPICGKTWQRSSAAYNEFTGRDRGVQSEHAAGAEPPSSGPTSIRTRSHTALSTSPRPTGSRCIWCRSARRPCTFPASAAFASLPASRFVLRWSSTTFRASRPCSPRPDSRSIHGAPIRGTGLLWSWGRLPRVCPQGFG